MKRATTVVLLMLLATLGDRQWFRIEHAAANVVQMRMAPSDSERLTERYAWHTGRILRFSDKGKAALAKRLRPIADQFAS